MCSFGLLILYRIIFKIPSFCQSSNIFSLCSFCNIPYRIYNKFKDEYGACHFKLLASASFLISGKHKSLNIGPIQSHSGSSSPGHLQGSTLLSQPSTWFVLGQRVAKCCSYDLAQLSWLPFQKNCSHYTFPPGLQ